MTTYEINVLTYRLDTSEPETWTVFVDGKEDHTLALDTAEQAEAWIECHKFGKQFFTA